MAAGETLVVFTPLGYEPPSTNYATLDTRNSHPVLDFDAAAATRAAVWTGVLPSNYSGNGITIYLHWAASTATSGNVVWQSSFEYISDGSLDIDSDGFASAVTWSAAATSGTSGIVTVSSQAHTNGAEIDSIVAGASFRLKIERLGSNGSDTMAGDAEIVAVELQET
jgi:hypothetical protein